jgi:hypothetical protein
MFFFKWFAVIKGAYDAWWLTGALSPGNQSHSRMSSMLPHPCASAYANLEWNQAQLLGTATVVS